VPPPSSLDGTGVADDAARGALVAGTRSIHVKRDTLWSQLLNAMV
jgi:hypothetical protein